MSNNYKYPLKGIFLISKGNFDPGPVNLTSLHDFPLHVIFYYMYNFPSSFIMEFQHLSCLLIFTAIQNSQRDIIFSHVCRHFPLPKNMFLHILIVMTTNSNIPSLYLNNWRVPSSDSSCSIPVIALLNYMTYVLPPRSIGFGMDNPPNSTANRPLDDGFPVITHEGMLSSAHI